jgi:NADPH-dependent F420 reductase
MNIAVIGMGNVGSVLGKRLAERGHTVIFGSRKNDTKTQEKARTLKGKLASVADAAAQCEVVILAVPWHAMNETLASAGNLDGKILLDCINPLKSDLTGLEVGTDTSGAEVIAREAPGARVVKIFNTTGAANMANPVYGQTKTTMSYAGDDAAAKKVAAQLASELGFEPVDAGPLKAARFLEPFAMLWIHMAIYQKQGPDFAFQMIRRPK